MNEKKAYAKAACIATEAISGIRTITAFRAHESVVNLFEIALAKDNIGVRRASFAAGIGQVLCLSTKMTLPNV